MVCCQGCSRRHNVLVTSSRFTISSSHAVWGEARTHLALSLSLPVPPSHFVLCWYQMSSEEQDRRPQLLRRKGRRKKSYVRQGPKSFHTQGVPAMLRTRHVRGGSKCMMFGKTKYAEFSRLSPLVEGHTVEAFAVESNTRITPKQQMRPEMGVLVRSPRPEAHSRKCSRAGETERTSVSSNRVRAWDSPSARAV